MSGGLALAGSEGAWSAREVSGAVGIMDIRSGACRAHARLPATVAAPERDFLQILGICADAWLLLCLSPLFVFRQFTTPHRLTAGTLPRSPEGTSRFCE